MFKQVETAKIKDEALRVCRPSLQRQIITLILPSQEGIVNGTMSMYYSNNEMFGRRDIGFCHEYFLTSVALSCEIVQDFHCKD